jgi:hypothetical protein
VVGYAFDLRTNEIKAEKIANPRAGTDHHFVAYRLKSQAAKPVSMVSKMPIPDDANRTDDE